MSEKIAALVVPAFCNLARSLNEVCPYAVGIEGIRSLLNKVLHSKGRNRFGNDKVADGLMWSASNFAL
jgi:hypothetical protein